MLCAVWRRGQGQGIYTRENSTESYLYSVYTTEGNTQLNENQLSIGPLFGKHAYIPYLTYLFTTYTCNWDI